MKNSRIKADRPKLIRVLFGTGIVFFLTVQVCSETTFPFYPLAPETGKAAAAKWGKPQADNQKKPADSLKTASRKKAFYLGIQVGAQFAELTQQNVLTRDLEALINLKLSRDSNLAAGDTNIAVTRSKILQSYDPVQAIFPLGIVAGVSLSKNLDLKMELQAFWFEQKSIVEEYNNRDKDAPVSSSSREYKYGMSAYLWGAGLKYYFPVEFITVDKGQFLYLSFTNYWDLGVTEFYNYGNATGASSLWGVGNEISVGYHLLHTKNLRILGQITFSNLEFQNKGTWDQITFEPNKESLTWNLNALKFNFHFVYPILFMK